MVALMYSGSYLSNYTFGFTIFRWYNNLKNFCIDLNLEAL